MLFDKMSEFSDKRSVYKCGDNRSDADADKSAKKNKIEKNAEETENDIINRFDFVHIFSEMD